MYEVGYTLRDILFITHQNLVCDLELGGHARPWLTLVIRLVLTKPRFSSRRSLRQSTANAIT